jgi:hypothetical protein
MDKKKILEECAKNIISLLVTTRAADREGLLNASKSMYDAVKLKETATKEEKQNWGLTVQFLEHLWRDDFKKIHAIVFES